MRPSGLYSEFQTATVVTSRNPADSKSKKQKQNTAKQGKVKRERPEEPGNLSEADGNVCWRRKHSFWRKRP